MLTRDDLDAFMDDADEADRTATVVSRPPASTGIGVFGLAAAEYQVGLALRPWNRRNR